MNFGVYAPNSGRVVNAQLKVLIADITLTNTGSFEMIPIPAGFDHLEIKCFLRSAATGTLDAVRIFYNGDTLESNYRTQYWNATGASTTTGALDWSFSFEVPAASSIANYFGNAISYVQDIARAGIIRGRYCVSQIRENATVSRNQITGTVWESTEPITSITIRTDNHPTDLFTVGSRVQVFGLGTFAVALAR